MFPGCLFWFMALIAGSHEVLENSKPLCAAACADLSKLKMFSMKTVRISEKWCSFYSGRTGSCYTSGPVDTSKDKQCLAAVTQSIIVTVRVRVEERYIKRVEVAAESRQWKLHVQDERGALIVVMWSKNGACFWLSEEHMIDWKQEQNMRTRLLPTDRSLSVSLLIWVWGHRLDFNPVMTEGNTHLV